MKENQNQVLVFFQQLGRGLGKSGPGDLPGTGVNGEDFGFHRNPEGITNRSRLQVRAQEWMQESSPWQLLQLQGS